METYLSPYVVLAIVALAGVGFVAVAYGANRLLAPRRPTREKLLTYESGVDPVGEGWAHTNIRYYIYAFLYVVFAVDAVYLFPWATVFADPNFGTTTLIEMFVFLGFLATGILRRPARSPDMAVTELGMPGHGHPDGEQIAGSVGPAQRLVPDPVRIVLNWGRRYSLWVFNFGLACCAIEFIAASMARHDFIRLGVIPFAPGPRQADLMVVGNGHRQDGPSRSTPL